MTDASSPAAASPRPGAAGVAALLFLSGACALVYQTVWIRELRLVFGSTTAASAAVLGVFMGGLGLGGAWLGRRAGAHPRPLKLYSSLELGIALSAAATPAALWAVRTLYLTTGGSGTLGSGRATVLRLVLSVLVLGVPTVLMGGTLPAAARAVTGDEDPGRSRVALLYGFNTLGAVFGVLASTFWLLEAQGNRRTLWLACAVNVGVALAARSRARGATDLVPEAAPAPVAAIDGKPAAPPGLVLAIAGICGFVFMLMELVWYRMLGPLLGGTTYTFGAILAVALLGIAVGGAGFHRWGRGRDVSLRHVALTCALEALLLAAPLALGDRLAVLAGVLRPLGVMGFAGLVSGWAVVAGIVVFPAAVVAGFQFPLLIALLGKGQSQLARQVGLAYAWNTVGSILGSLAGGFGFLPLLSAPGTWRLAAALSAWTGIVAAIGHARRTRTFTGLALPLALGVLAVVAGALDGPSAFWRHSAIGAGRAIVAGAQTRNLLEQMQRDARRALHWEKDGLETAVALLKFQGLTFVVNGKADGSAFADSGTQVMGPLVGAALHPGVKRALVVGLGTGSSAGWLASVPSVERVDVVELEPAIAHVAREMRAVNQNALDNPKLHLFWADAREHLLTTREKYDLIMSEPSNPYRAGVASLYTREYYQAVRGLLAEGGIFLQWMQTYEVQPRTVRTVLATLRSAYPHVEVWNTARNDLLLVASASPVPHDVLRLTKRLSEEPFLSALRATWRGEGVEAFLAHHLGGPAVATALLKRWPDDINTDDLNRIEFAFARAVGTSEGMRAEEVAESAERLGARWPAVTGGVVDQDRVLQEAAFWGLSLDSDTAGLSPEGKARRDVFAASRKQLETLWSVSPFEPRGLRETLVLAWALADGGRGDAETFLDRLDASLPVEAAILRALLRQRQERLEESVQSLREAFRRLRTHAWCDESLGKLAMARLAPELAARLPAAAPGFIDDLREPFPAFGLEQARLGARMGLAYAWDFEKTCADVLAAYEPAAVWDDEFLSRRVQCYRATHSPLQQRAERDLTWYLLNQSQPFFPQWELPAAKPTPTPTPAKKAAPAPDSPTEAEEEFP